MELTYKKIGILIGFVALVAVLGFLIYFLFFRSEQVAVSPDTPLNETTGGQLPTTNTGSGGSLVTETGSGGLPQSDTTPVPSSDDTTLPLADAIAAGGLTRTTRLSTTPSLAPIATAEGGARYYNQADGKFYRITPTGIATTLSDKTFFNAQRITWAPDQQKAIIEYPDGSNITYDFTTGRQVSLPKHWEDFHFAPDGSALVAKSIGSDTDNRWLLVANDDGSQAQAIAPIGDNDATVYPSWSPNNLSIAMYSESIDFDRQRLYFVGLNGENFKSTVIDGRGFEHQWDPTGSGIIYSVYSSDTQLKPMLWAVSAQGETIGANRRTLNVQTWAHKCSFADTQTLYCAVPDSLPEGAGLFPELGQTSADSLYRINVATGAQELVAIPDGTYNIANLSIDRSGSVLYFTDTFSDELHSIRLR